ncbi:MAG: hypothetical protein ACLU3I_02925 [Acutalibacteraceae bacterium]
MLTAVLGGLLICSGGSVPNLSFQNLLETSSMIAPLKIAVVASFLGMTKQFTGNVSQVSQQINAIVMARGGRERIFELIDEQPEDDNGYVTLVNAVRSGGRHADRERRAHRRLGLEAPAQADGTSHLHEALRATCVFFDVDFGYDPEKHRAARHLALRQARAEDRLRRRDRRGQDHHHEPHQPLLRH